jgi:hypothetical protein
VEENGLKFSVMVPVAPLKTVIVESPPAEEELGDAEHAESRSAAAAREPTMPAAFPRRDDFRDIVEPFIGGRRREEPGCDADERWASSPTPTFLGDFIMCVKERVRIVTG